MRFKYFWVICVVPMLFCLGQSAKAQQQEQVRTDLTLLSPEMVDQSPDWIEKLDFNLQDARESFIRDRYLSEKDKKAEVVLLYLFGRHFGTFAPGYRGPNTEGILDCPDGTPVFLYRGDYYYVYCLNKFLDLTPEGDNSGGVHPEYITLGCLDPEACNYNASADSNQQNMCEYNSCVDCEGVKNGFASRGSTCDDGNANTIDDHYNEHCECIGTPKPAPEREIVERIKEIEKTDTIPACTNHPLFAENVKSYTYVQGETGLQFFGFTDSNGRYIMVPLSLQGGHEHFYMKDPANCKARSFYIQGNFGNLQARALDPDKCRLIDWHMWKSKAGVGIGHNWWRALNDDLAFRHGPTVVFDHWFMDAENKRGIELANSRPDLPDVPVAYPNALYAEYNTAIRYNITSALYTEAGLNLGYSFTQKRYWAGPSLKIGYALSNIFGGKSKNTINSQSKKSTDEFEAF